ncbi:MAG TPA: diguanylate cyclase [Clostridia bacterium]|nr:diguanylate cyclase [Clostridia bacterium]
MKPWGVQSEPARLIQPKIPLDARRANEQIRSPIDPNGGAAYRRREAQRPEARPVTGDAAAVGRAALMRLAGMRTLDDPMTASALRFAARHGQVHNAARLLASWRMRALGHPGLDAEYPWTLPRDSAAGSPDYVLPGEASRLWRPREADAYLRNPTSYGHRLLGPIVIAEALELLSEILDDRGGELADAPIRLLDDVRPRVEREVAAYIQGDDPWRDTFILWLLASRPRAREMLDPLCRAIATRYATTAGWTAGLVCGVRYPFDGTPLVSASAHLAHGLWALGYNPRALPGLLRFVAESRSRNGGWADDGQPEDVLTTLAAADLLLRVDPEFDPEPTIEFLARMQEPAGWWRALDPEVPWLTGAVVDWLEDASRPFPERFRWPGFERASRDRRTQLPWWAAFGDVLIRTFERVPGLAGARIDMAFIDLAGFGAFNTANGQAAGDEVLRVLGRALANLPDCQALRDGGDEFIVVGAPTHDGLEAALDRFRRAWPGILGAAMGGAPPVPCRIVVTSTTGGAIDAARTELGRVIGAVKAANPQPAADGVLTRVEREMHTP